MSENNEFEREQELITAICKETKQKSLSTLGNQTNGSELWPSKVELMHAHSKT